MSRVGYLLLLIMLVASTQIAQARTGTRAPLVHHSLGRAVDSPTQTPVVPTVEVPTGPAVAIPTVAVPRPAHKHHKKKVKGTAGSASLRRRNETWVWAYLTSYCPGSAGGISSSGLPVFYGMLANDYYAFGTRVYIPVIGIVGVVEDHVGDYAWNHFDVWSPVCYGTPTGWFRVAVEG